jgi:hypothetical protein
MKTYGDYDTCNEYLTGIHTYMKSSTFVVFLNRTQLVPWFIIFIFVWKIRVDFAEVFEFEAFSTFS